MTYGQRLSAHHKRFFFSMGGRGPGRGVARALTAGIAGLGAGLAARIGASLIARGRAAALNLAALLLALCAALPAAVQPAQAQTITCTFYPGALDEHDVEDLTGSISGERFIVVRLDLTSPTCAEIPYSDDDSLSGPYPAIVLRPSVLVVCTA